jgi:8-oxo-dGTP pyrophosphatase MutT (NUDIX family)
MTGRIYTHPDVLTVGIAQGWADPETDPTRIDWPARQARALLPFEVEDGRPVNPVEPDHPVQRGRNELGLWGENPMADALACATYLGHRYVAMVEREDGHGWAIPGGSIKDGEDPTTAVLRELREETGLRVTPDLLVSLRILYVPDPRGSREAWAVTGLATFDMGNVDELPAPTGADDTLQAAWVRADSYDTLVGELAAIDGGHVFAAHRDMLADALNDGSRS